MHTLYTIGYSRLRPADILRTAERLNALIADIRISPRSRLPEWNQKPLQATWGERYLHIPELGNRNYKGEYGEGVVLDNPERGAARILVVLERQPIVLLCACFDWRTCHRRDAADFIAARADIRVIHLSVADVVADESDGDTGQLPLFSD